MRGSPSNSASGNDALGQATEAHSPASDSEPAVVPAVCMILDSIGSSNPTHSISHIDYHITSHHEPVEVVDADSIDTMV